MTQIEFVDECFFKLGALARRIGDRDLNETAFPCLAEDPVDALAGHLQPLRDRVLGLTFPEIVPADFGHQSGVGPTIAGFAFIWCRLRASNQHARPSIGFRNPLFACFRGGMATHHIFPQSILLCPNVPLLSQMC
jgi:hypothetical protein